MEKKNTAVVIGGTSNHSFAMGAFLVDLRKSVGDLVDEVVVFHDGKLSQRDRAAMEKIYPIRFIPYQFPVSGVTALRNESVSYFSQMVFCKYECLRLLDDYRTVIWSDYDVVIIDNIKEILLPCGAGVRMILDQDVTSCCFAPIPNYNMSGTGMSAALIVFHGNIGNHSSMYEFCYRKTLEYIDKLYMPEQAIFSIMIQEYNLNPEHLDIFVYACHPSSHGDHPEAKILHSYGAVKFWNGLHNRQWEENYAHWLQLGGSRKETALVVLWRKIKRKISSRIVRVMWR